MSGTLLRSNPIGKSIYNKIQDYDNMACQVFQQHCQQNTKIYLINTELQEMLLIKKGKDDNLEKQIKKQKKGMKKLRATKSKEEIAEQRKVWDTTYYNQMREKTAKRIQKVAREFITKKKVKG